MNKPVLEARQLTIGYTYTRRPATVVAQSLSLTLGRGTLVCLLGPNGVGKSTLLRTITGMQPPLAGQVTLLGENIHTMPPRQLARCLSLVLTERIDVGALSAYELVALGRHPYTDWSGRLTAADEVIIRQSLETVGAQTLASRQVNELSDGERQKVMIARALAQEPTLMILDEPTAFLDLPRRVEILRILRHLAHETGRTVLLSTHDLDLALRSADRLWLMSADGSLHVGAPEDLVLNGSFEATFQSEGVRFDVQSGSFQMNEPTSTPVRVTGAGVAAVWTIRALERAGYHVVSDANVPHITLIQEGSQYRWKLTTAQTTDQCDSIEVLIRRLRQFKTRDRSI